MAQQPETIGAQIRAAREAAGITAVELARALGVSTHRVALRETGAPEPLDVTMLERIARLLGVTFTVG